MGLHTWFLKDKELFYKEREIDRKLDNYEEGKIYLDDLEILTLNRESEELYKENKTEFHDIFRTGKRNEDGSYTDDIIESEEECYRWLENNEHGDVNYKSLKEFWTKYPNGIIEFG